MKDFYCDLDGVLVNFIKGYYDLTGIDITGNHRTDANFWKPIDKAGKEFWINLEWNKDGKELWDYIKKYDPKLLSAPAKSIGSNNDSRIGKIEWVKRELPNVKLILRSAEKKKDLATKDSVLIDDREENINGWVENGGIGILHKNTKDTIKQLKKLGL